MIGKTISHYKILEKLGEGGMGVVYKAEDTRLKRTVALKFLNTELMRDPQARERFLHEAQAASSLNHPNIAVIYEINEDEPQCFICMEYVEGKSIKQLIEEKTLSMADILKMAVATGEGLYAAHQKGIVHRDIKPDNIMVTGDGLVKIMDFGLAKYTGASRVTREGTTLGTVPYMSPEQVQGIDVDHRSDIFSFGTVLYEMITGRLPFRGEHEAAVIYSIIHEAPEPLARYKAEVPEGLQHVIDKALAKAKEERYQHVDEMVSDLRTVVRLVPLVVKKSRKRKKVALCAAVGMVLLLLLALGVLRLWQKPAAGGEKSIAVLPFADFSPQKDQEYFCDGLTEELINRLSHIQKLRVPARTSAFIFKDKMGDIKAIGEKLKVQTVLEGSVRKAGDELRVTAQLINVADGYHLWSETYDRKLADVFAIQDEISAAIVHALQLKLTPQEAQGLAQHAIENIKAYELYLKAWRQIYRFDEKSLDSAFVFLQTAIDIVGDNAQLYSGMSTAYAMRANIGIGQEDDLVKAEEYAKKALALNPGLASALVELNILSIYDAYPKNWYNAFRYTKRALAANPFSSDALRALAIDYAQIGRPEEALKYADLFEKYDPLNHWRHAVRGLCCHYDGRFEPAIQHFRMFYQADSTSPNARTLYMQALAYGGKWDEALALADRKQAPSARNVQDIFALLLKCAILKDKEDALRLMTPEFVKTCRRDFEWSFYVADRMSLLGAREEALDWLENAITRGFINYPFLQCNPLLDPVRDEERFRNLMARAKKEWQNFEVPE
ncbi:protein kinase [bacterium]|nr:protein kinase [bacterium]